MPEQLLRFDPAIKVLLILPCVYGWSGAARCLEDPEMPDPTKWCATCQVRKAVYDALVEEPGEERPESSSNERTRQANPEHPAEVDHGLQSR